MKNRWIRWGGLAAMTCLLLACERFESKSIGDLDAIIVVADAEEWAAVEAPMRAALEEVVFTPQRETVFDVRRVDPANFRYYEQWHNLVILATLDSEGPATRMVREMLAPDALAGVEAGRYFVFEPRDVFARGQVLMVLAGPDSPTLAENIRQNVEPLRRSFYRARRSRVYDRVYKRPSATELIQLLAGRYDWALQLPAGFVRAREPEDADVVWLRSFSPDLFISVAWFQAMSAGALTPEWLLEKRRQVLHEYADGMEVDPRHQQQDLVLLAGYDAIRWRGLWRIPGKVVGGPFACYGFYDEETRRIFMVDLAVFAPDREKIPLLLELEVIAETFHTVAPPPIE